MTIADLKKYTLPKAPGVYFFMGKHREILYVGKASSIRSRVQSYFTKDIAYKRSPLIEKMIADATGLKTIQTDSVLEAFLLETNLIRAHQPKYNTVAKDDKSFNHVLITREKYPRILIVRGKELAHYTEDSILRVFGPFPQGSLFKEALKIVRSLFQFYDERALLDTAKPPTKFTNGVVDFNRQIGLYPNNISTQEYKRTIKHLILFFEGKKHMIIKDLERKMMQCAKEEQFEEATILKRKIFALRHIQDVALLTDTFKEKHYGDTTRIEGYDVAHMQGEAMIGVMTVLVNRELLHKEYRSFIIKTISKPNDLAALHEVLERRLMHTEWQYPSLIVVDGGLTQKNTAEKVLHEAGVAIPIVSVVKNKQHKPVKILGSRSIITRNHDDIIKINAEAHRFSLSLHRKKLRKNRISK